MARAATTRPLLYASDKGDQAAIMIYCSSTVRKLPNGDPAIFVDWTHETKATGASESSKHLLHDGRKGEDRIQLHLWRCTSPSTVCCPGLSVLTDFFVHLDPTQSNVSAVPLRYSSFSGSCLSDIPKHSPTAVRLLLAWPLTNLSLWPMTRPPTLTSPAITPRPLISRCLLLRMPMWIRFNRVRLTTFTWRFELPRATQDEG